MEIIAILVSCNLHCFLRSFNSRFSSRISWSMDLSSLSSYSPYWVYKTIITWWTLAFLSSCSLWASQRQLVRQFPTTHTQASCFKVELMEKISYYLKVASHLEIRCVTKVSPIGAKLPNTAPKLSKVDVSVYHASSFFCEGGTLPAQINIGGRYGFTYFWKIEFLAVMAPY